MKNFLLGLASLTLLASTTVVHADEPKSKDTEVKPNERPSTADLNLFWVPWGMHYTRAAWGMQLGYKIPLVQKPGVLWETTYFAAGVRDVYGYVNNSSQVWAELVPIAVFKVRAEGAYDVFIPPPFNGGMRLLTANGTSLLEQGKLQNGSKDQIDWVHDESLGNRAIFQAPITSGGFRFRLMPTLQGKLGPISFQYNFTADWNWYHAPLAPSDAIYQDNFTFTLRRLHDFDHAHELLVAYNFPVKAPAEVLVGVSARYHKTLGTGLDQLSLNSLFFLRWPKKFWGERMSPFAGGNVGTHLIDPMWRYAFSWILVVGADFNLYKSKVADAALKNPRR